MIDVYPNPTAAYCDQVITIKAGTDGALALSMMHVLKNEHLVDKSFVEKYTSGYPAFAETLDAYTPEWAESETGIPAEVIRQLAREFGRGQSTGHYTGQRQFPSRQRRYDGASDYDFIRADRGMAASWRRIMWLYAD